MTDPDTPDIGYEHTVDTLTQLAAAYATEMCRDDTPPELNVHLTPIRNQYPLPDFTPLITALNSTPTPAPYTREPQYDAQTQYEAEFLIQVGADIITYSYVTDDFDRVPAELFNSFYDTPTPQSEPVNTALSTSALGAFHPEIDYKTEVIMSNRLEFTSLFSHLQLIWCVAPKTAFRYYRWIMTHGCPTLEESEPTDPTADTGVYAEFTDQFVGAVLFNPSNPYGDRKASVVRLDQIRNTDEESVADVVQDLAEFVVEHIEVENLHLQTRTRLNKVFE